MNLVLNNQELNNYLSVIGKLGNGFDNRYNLNINSSVNGLNLLTEINENNDFISKSVENVNGSNFNSKVNSNDFFKFIKSLDGEQISFRTSKATTYNQLLTVKSNDTTIELSGIDETTEHDTIKEVKNGFNIKATEFIKMVDQLKKAMGNEKYMPTIRSINISMDYSNDAITFAAIDGFRLHTKRITNIEFINPNNTKEDITIDKITINSLQPMLKRIKTALKKNFDDILTVKFDTDNNVSFDCNGYVLTTKAIDGEYFDYNSIFPTEFYNHITIQKEELMKALKKIRPIEREKGQSVTRFDLAINEIYLSARNENVKITVDLTNNCDYDYKDEFTEGFNTQYLIDAIDKFDRKSEVELHFTDNPVAPIMITNNEGENKKNTNLILPVRLNS